MKFSIIVPCYNIAPYLRECLDSVLVQEYGDWECICVDDGSSDGTRYILDEYAKKDRRFKVVHQANSGVGEARNNGLRHAIGDWVAFLDGDDVLSSIFLATLSKMIKELNPDIAFTAYSKFTQASDIRWNDSNHTDVINVRSKIPVILASRCLWGGAFKRDVVQSIEFRPYCRGEDLLFVSQCLVRASIVAISAIEAYGYRVRSGSAMTSPMTLRKLRDRIGYSLEWIEALNASGRGVDRAIYRNIGLNLTEGFVSDIFRLPGRDREAAWAEWYSCLQLLRRFDKFPSWTKFVIRANNFVRSNMLASALCAVPYWLKAKGFHR